MASLNERLKLKKLVKKLKEYRGRHTELISVYLPPGQDLTKLINTLQDEQGTATNIKDKNTSKSVISALERMIRTLKTIPQTPPNGLAVFSGNISQKDNVDNFEVFLLEPPEPVPLKLYRCEQRFITAPLEEMGATESTYGLIAIDKSEATIGLLVGSTIKVIKNMNSTVPGKFKTGGQCLLPDTMIQSATGNIIKIEDLNENEILNSADLSDYRLKTSNILDKWETKKDKIYTISTKFPKLQIQSSKDHLYFIYNKELDKVEEKNAEELKNGDILLMPEKINIDEKRQKIDSKKYYNSFYINEEGQELLKTKRESKKLLQKELAHKIGVTQTTVSSYEIGKININRNVVANICNVLEIKPRQFIQKHLSVKHHQNTSIILPKELDCDFAQFIGYFIGDGCIEEDRITLFEQRKEVALKYKKQFDEYFNMNSSFRFREEKSYYQLRFTSKALTRLFKEEFPEIKKALDTLIPKKILESDNKVVCKFIKGLYDAEGFITNHHLGIGMNNKDFIRQLQMLLMRFSIITSIYKSDNDKNPYSDNSRYNLQITEKKSLQIFSKLIGFTATDKKEKLDELIESSSSRSNVRQILVSGNKIRQIIEEAGYNLEQFPKVTNFFRNERMMSKQAFRSSILNYIEDVNLLKKLETILDYEILPVVIDKIEIEEKEVKMFDISVENQNFIANGIIAHNSAQRFARIREGAAVEFYKRVADATIQEFTFMKELKGIIVGGPGTTKNNFVDGNYMNEDIKKKIIGIKDITYTSSYGLKELMDKSQDLLANDEIMTERRALQEFFETLAKKTNFIVYGYERTKTALEMSAIEKLIVIDEIISDEQLEELSTLAENSKTQLILVTDKTPEGVQFKGITGIGGILRYPIES